MNTDNMPIEDRLKAIEGQLALLVRAVQTQLASSGSVDCMSVHDAATASGFSAWTLRQACSKGRIEGAFKRSDTTWMIPAETVIKIKTEGLPQVKSGKVAGSPSPSVLGTNGGNVPASPTSCVQPIHPSMI